MAFANFSLLLGGGLIAVPIVLHLLMRRQPKHVVFPALRFIKQRQQTNRRKLQLRHWILLMLRCLAIALLAAALARPSAASTAVGAWTAVLLVGFLLITIGPFAALSWMQEKGRLVTGSLTAVACLLLVLFTVLLVSAMRKQPPLLIGDREAPVAAVLVIDTSPRMAYRRDNKTRLEQAQQTALWLIGQLPPDSEVAVLDSQLAAAVFSVDLAAARKSVERLQTTAAPKAMGDLIVDARGLLATSNLDRKELYIFSDLTEAAWRGVASRLKSAATSQDDNTYVIDVGAEQPGNFALGDLRLSAQLLPQNGAVELRTELRCLGESGSRTVELQLEESDPHLPVIQDDRMVTPKARQRGRQVVRLDSGAAVPIEFSLTGLPLGVHHGVVKLSVEDGLPVDDIRYFTIRVDEAWPILIVAPENAWPVFFSQALAPDDERDRGTRFAITEAADADLGNQTLSDFDVVCLLDPKPMPPGQWRRLADYVERGGALLVALGRNANSYASFNAEDAQRLLPGPISRQWRAADGDLFIDLRRFNHPATAVFRQRATSTPWPQFPVFRHWVMDSLHADVQAIVSFSNGKPAILERPVGKGSVIVLTTPLSEPGAGPQRRGPWNELASGNNNWPPFLLVNTMMRYLVESGEARLNYFAGESASLTNSSLTDPARYQLFTPDGNPQDVAARDGRLVVNYTDVVGAYRLKGNRGGPVSRGFSVNAPAQANDLRRIDPQRLDDVFGKDNYQLARKTDEIERVQGKQRVGREFYPLLLCLLVLVLGLEHLLSNRFYPPETVSPTGAGD